MAIIENENRFSLPVEAFLQQVLQEKHPKLNVAPGSAVYDLIITPAAVIQQQMRDRMRVIQRNQSLSNFSTMLPEEMDRLASNFFVTRRSGTRATGQQRVYFSVLQNVTIPTTAQFSNDTGLIFKPISQLFVSSTTLAFNIVAETGEYYVDVPVIADQIGENYRLLAGRITRFSGIVGATRTSNLFEMTGGSYAESNSELYARIKKSLSSRDTVKSGGIRSLILENFSSVKDVIVQGYGDPYMTRDTATVVMSIDKMFESSFAQKVNLPLDQNGNVAWTDSANELVVAPIGGYVGAIYDLTGKDFNSLLVSLDGRKFDTISIQPGFKIRFIGEEDPDKNIYYVVTRVEEVPIELGGDLVKVARLDRPLVGSTNADTAAAGAEYTVYGFVNVNNFHVGGKIDVYVKSSEESVKEVIVSSLPATESESVTEVPLTSTFLSETGQNYFEGNIGFDGPVNAVLKVEEIDAVDADTVIRTLEPDINYKIIRQEFRGQFTRAASDVLRIEGAESFLDQNGDPTGIEYPAFIGARIKITYATNPDINAIQSFVDQPQNRDVTSDIEIKSPETVLIDVRLSYKGSRPQEEIASILSRYIQNKGFGASISVNEILTVLAYFGVKDVSMPVLLTSSKNNGDGTYTIVNSEDRLEIGPIEMFKAVSELSVTKTGV